MPKPPWPSTDDDLVAADRLPGLQGDEVDLGDHSGRRARLGPVMALRYRAGAPSMSTSPSRSLLPACNATGSPRLQRLLAHPGAVGRAEILDLQRLARDAQPGMAARHGGMGHDEVALVGGAADHHAVASGSSACRA